MNRRFLNLGGAVAAAVALTGCVHVPPPPALATPVPSRFTADPGDTVTSPIALSHWWRLFHDPQLDALIAGALTDAPDLRSVQARVAEADATMSRALRRFDPQGGVSSSIGTRAVDQLSGDINLPNLPVDVPLVQTGRTTLYNSSFNVSWEIDLFGRRGATAVVARARLYSAQLQAAAAQAGLAATIADAVFVARGLAAELAGARTAQATERDAVALLDRRIARGLLPGGDRLPATARLRAATLQVDQLATDLDVARRQLLVLVGRGTAPLSDLVVTPVLADAPAVPVTTPGALLERRPDVMAARSAVSAALGNRTLAKLDFFPTFSLTPGIGIERQERPANSFATGFWSLGLGLVMPILDRGRLMAELRASDARVTQAVGDYEKSVQTAYGEADTVLTQLVSDHRQLAGIVANARDVRAYHDLMRRGEAAGLLDPDMAVTAQRQRQSADIDVVRARVLVLRRSVQAFKALGGGWDTHDACAQGRGCGS